MMKTQEAVQMLEDLMRERYQIDQVVDEYRDGFEEQIRGMLGSVDAEMEGFSDPDKQRDLSVKFTWGHDHDFGSFSLKGQMENRHIHVLADFITSYGLPVDLRGKKILDVGAWTGGISLLLAALGAEVTALEEVVKYARTIDYLARAFDVPGLRSRSQSLYDLDDQDCYDYIIYSGVIYHVTDPVLSLRILFNALRDNGRLFVETFAIRTNEGAPAVALVEGPEHIRGGRKEDLNRGGWNYFVPSPDALATWMKTVGFQTVQVGAVDIASRIKAVGWRERHCDMLRAGLSRPGIR